MREPSMQAAIDRIMQTYDLLANRTSAASSDARAKVTGQTRFADDVALRLVGPQQTECSKALGHFRAIFPEQRLTLIEGRTQ